MQTPPSLPQGYFPRHARQQIARALEYARIVRWLAPASPARQPWSGRSQKSGDSPMKPWTAFRAATGRDRIAGMGDRMFAMPVKMLWEA